jgi:hypothetical protein
VFLPGVKAPEATAVVARPAVKSRPKPAAARKKVGVEKAEVKAVKAAAKAAPRRKST